MTYTLSFIDWGIISAFLLITFIIGLIERKKLTLDDYWVNNRKTNRWVLLATLFSTFVGAGAILGNASIAFKGGGIAIIVIALSFCFYFFIFGHFFAHKIKEYGDKHKFYSLPDWLEHRYSRKVGIMSSIVNLITYSLFLALQILAIGVLVGAISDFSPVISTIIGASIVIIYTSIGGLRADIRTDVFQAIVMLFLLTVLLPVAIFKGGGIGAISSLPSSFLTGQEFAPWYVFVLAFLFVGASTLSSSDIWQRAYAADTQKNARWASRVSSILVLLFLGMGTLLGIYGKIILPNAEANSVVFDLLFNLLPPVFIGFVVAGFFAAIMSSADTMLLITSMTVLHDIYYKSTKKKPSQEELLKKTRWATLIIGILSLIISLIIFDIAHLSIEAVTFSVVLIPTIVFGFYWKRANSKAAFWSILLGMLTVIGFMFIDPVQAFIPGTIVSFVVFILVTKFTKKED